jgi:hypothetical protein
MSTAEVTKKDMRLLGAVFAREIEGGLLQSKSKEYTRLEAEGMVFKSSKTLHFKDNLGPMTVEGWNLTPRGHMLYCTNCKEPDDVETI